MGLSLSKNQMLVLMFLAFVTIIVLGLITFATVAHIDVWRSIMSLKMVPDIQYPH